MNMEMPEDTAVVPVMVMSIIFLFPFSFAHLGCALQNAISFLSACGFHVARDGFGRIFLLHHITTMVFL